MNGVYTIKNDFDRSPLSKPKVEREVGKGAFIDNVLLEIKFGILNYILIIIGGIVTGGIFWEICSISYVLPTSECDLNLTLEQKGMIAAASFIGIITSSYIWGYLADIKGRRYVAMPALFIGFLLTICSSLSGNFYFLFTFRCLNGFFISSGSVTILAYLGEFHGGNHRTLALTAWHFVSAVITLVLPLIAFSIINQEWQFEVPLLDLTYKPWRLFLIACGIPLFLVSIALFFLPESPKFVLDQGKQEETIQILERINRWNNGKGAELGYTEIYEEAESIENRRKAMEETNGRFAFFKSIYSQTVPIVKPPYLKPTLLLCAIIFMNYSMANGFYLFFVTIVNQYNSNLDQFNNQKVEMCHIISMNGTSSAEMIDESISCVPAKIEVATLVQSTILDLVYVVG